MTQKTTQCDMCVFDNWHVGKCVWMLDCVLVCSCEW